MPRNDIRQDRIGTHPADWKLEPHIELMLRGVDAKIRPILRVMCAGGIETFESCQGGKGHAYPEPTICFHGNQSEGFRALAWCRTYGIKVGDLRRYWTIEQNEPHGPDWQMTFRF
jgi:hypothetical protein